MKVFLLFCMLAFTAGCFSQAGYSWQAAVYSGNYISHRQYLVQPPHLQYGFSVELNKKTNGNKYWQFAHNYPQMGLLLMANTLGDHQVYGEAISVLPYLEFNVLKSKAGVFQIKHGTGVAYVTRRYDAIKNPSNVILSTRINATSILDFGYRFYLSEKCELKAGANIHHISNGGFTLPNRGANTLAGYLAISFYPGDKEIEVKKFDVIRPEKKMQYRIGTAIGFYDYQKNEGTVKVNAQFCAMAFYQHNTRFRTGGGTEIGFLNTIKPEPAIYAEEEVQFANITTRYGFGYYLANKRPADEDFYSKIGLAYYPKFKGVIPKGFYIGSILKAHKFTAAHIEMLAGYAF
jgi:hypothetical protein